jgi:hypothetical protein
VIVTLIALVGIVLSMYGNMVGPVVVPTGYERAWARLPERHRMLVRGIYRDRDSSAQARRRTMTIHLKKQDGHPESLWHEVGHLVRWADNPLASDWEARFWRRGTLSGVAPSDYARTSPSEDFAESYQELLENGSLEDCGRVRFMMNHVFRRGEVPNLERRLRCHSVVY